MVPNLQKAEHSGNFVPVHAGDVASRVSTGGLSGAGRCKNQNSPARCVALLDCLLALGTVHSYAIGDRVMGGEHGLRDMEHVIDHDRSGIGLSRETELGRTKLSHAFGMESAGLGIPTNGDPQLDGVKTDAKHFASG